MTEQAGLPKRIIEYLTDTLEEYDLEGTPFFDRMDALVSSDYFYQIQADRFSELYGQEHNVSIVVSGKWGYGFKMWSRKYAPHLWPYWVPGGLRHNELPVHGGDMDLVFVPGNYRYRKFVFLDNSCYKGRTRDKIKARIEEADGELIDSLVIYDGSIEPLDGMKGIFRYHL